MIQHLFYSWLLQARNASYAFFKTIGIKTNVKAGDWPTANLGYLLYLSFLSMFVVTAQAQILPTNNYSNLTKAGSNLFFTANNASGQAGLWKIDAIAGGPTLVKTVAASQLTAVGSNLYFSANEQETGYELWKSDGTPAGTVKVKDVPLQLPLSEYDYDSDIVTFRASIGLTGTNNLLYFTANNAIRNYELWRTDGTAAGTFKVMNVAVEPRYYDEPKAQDFRTVGNTLFFTVENTAVSDMGIYKTEGDPQSTILIKQAYSPQLLSPVNGILYFKVNNSGQIQLWKTTGTQAGTSLIKDLGLGFEIEENVAIGNNLYFRSTSSPTTTGYELWKSDGTAAGTRLVKDIYPGTQGSAPSSLVNVNGTLYFAAYTDTYGHALWKSDGTETGTTLVKDPFPGSASDNPYYLQLFYLINVNNTLYFVTRSESGGHILWKSDGTTAGTVKIKDTFGESLATLANFTNFNGVLYFTAANGAGIKLWKSDGTTAGTVPVETSTHQALNKLWDKTFGGNIEDELSITIATSDNGYLLAGYSYSGVSGDKSQASKGNADYWIVKTDASGNKLWDKTFGTSNSDALTAAIQTWDGGYLLGGYTNAGQGGDKSEPTRGGMDYWIVKTDASGNKLWDKRFGGTATDELKSILQLSDGNYLLAGISNSNQGGDKSQNSKSWNSGGSYPDFYDTWLVKINSSGVKLWDKTIGTYDDEKFGAVVASADGGYLVAVSYFTPLVEQYFVYYKVDSNGNVQWSGSAGNADGENVVTSAIQTQDGGYLVAGYSSSNAGPGKMENSKGGRDYFVVKLTGNGVKQWNKTIGGSSSDELSQVLQLSDNDYLLSGTSYSPMSGDKTENSAGADYWLVKLDANGNKLWDKTFGGSGDDKLKSLLQTVDKGYLLSGTSNSLISGDKTQLSRGSYDYWLLKTVGNSPEPITCSATGSILQEKWLNVTGNSVSAIPVNTAPASTSQLTSFETSANTGNNYGERIRGYLCVPASGSYTFYIAGDDKCELYISSDEDPSKKTLIASVPYSTAVKEWSKYASQKSVAISLVAGKKYYIEALHKEGIGDDKVAVGWQTPNQTTIAVIAGSYLSPYLVQLTGKISREFWANVTGYQISNIPLTTDATTIDEVTIFERATNQGENYGQRFRGYLHPQVSGNYRFYISGDDKAELWLSTDEDPSKKTKIALVSAYTALRQWDKYASQQSVVIALVAGRKYYIEALHKENTGNDNISVGWQLPNQTTISVIAGTFLSPFLASPSSSMARISVEESLPSRVSLYPNPFESKLTFVTQQAGKLYISVVDNLGRTVYQISTQVTSAETTLDLAYLKQGVYIVKVARENGATQVLKVVKQ
ncbi:T9SS type A sorting domain-containing protein [Rhodocytophaga rosea]|uniref:T9SS type A sorting domain-containing protein n=1 Tax=Rhodocytophaga rosea TaxID=2704465 RepID=A0A6C0GBI4_9BACT|nr:PA14 domain-containing protein [Rhodocytophaga rosea]QHT65257.1 T9SS type A sorting domain-containing protein [Rhodocytophaga rosea]